jgi:hypothetical protein
MATFTYVHKVLQNPVCNRLYKCTHLTIPSMQCIIYTVCTKRGNIYWLIMANECLCKNFCSTGFYSFVFAYNLMCFPYEQQCLCN